MLAFVAAAKATGFTVVVETVMDSISTDNTACGTEACGGSWRAILNQKIRDGAVANGYLVSDVGADAVLGCTGCYTNLAYFLPDQTHLQTAGWVVKGSYMAAILTTLGFE